MEPLENLRAIRQQKILNLKKQDINPYPAVCSERIFVSEAREKDEGAKVRVAGRIMGMRTHGKIDFFDLSDTSGHIQLVFKDDTLTNTAKKIKENLDIGDFVGAEGKIFTTKSGELSVEVFNLKVLAKSLRPLPEKHEGLKDIETRYRQRYADLIINSEVKETFLKRSRIVNELRNYLNCQGFTEVETPILQPLYGGASAKPFITHHKSLDTDFYLRISDELYLKRLIAGGFERVYEFGKDFRNEGMDRQHNPEFTMLEFYWAYSNYENLMKFTEEMLSHVVNKVVGSMEVIYQGEELDFTPPWERVTYHDLILKDSEIDIDIITTEKELLEEIKKKEVKLDLKGVAGYGAILDEFYKKVSRPKIKGPLFLTNHPYQLRPLAKKLETDPSKVASFQLLIKGFEILNAYNELNDPADQRKRWEDEMTLGGKGYESYQELDEDYIRALEYGMPPTAGWGMGIDRFTAIITDQPSVKDVILFPTLKPES